MQGMQLNENLEIKAKMFVLIWIQIQQSVLKFFWKLEHFNDSSFSHN